MSITTRNLQFATDMAAEFIVKTWRDVVVGGVTAPNGAPKLRFDNDRQRMQYADSIIIGDSLDMRGSGRFHRKIVATHSIAGKTERGYPAWDMKPMLLGGPKARAGKRGRYNVIPFRHGTTNSGSGIFRPMPKSIHEQAKNLRATQGVGRRIVRQGGRLVGTEGAFPALVHKFRKSHGRTGSYQRKSGIYEGMVRMQSEGAKGSQYYTFRTVSERSAPDSWWHSGRPAQPHIEFIKNYCMGRIIPNIKRAAIQDMIPEGAVSAGLDITGQA